MQASFSGLVQLSIILTMTACVSANVRFITNPQQDKEGYIKFRLTSSHILISDSGISQEKIAGSIARTRIEPSQIGVSVVPKEDTSALYAIVPKSQWLWLVQTRLSATFYDNTRLIHELGTEVADNRIKAIQVIGDGLKVIAALKEPKKEIVVPIVINPDETNSDQWYPVPGNDGDWQFMLHFNKATNSEPDSVDRDVFFRDFRNDGWFNSTSVFPVSSCTNATLKLRYSGLDVIREQVKNQVAQRDPRNEREGPEQYEERIKPQIEQAFKSWMATKSQELQTKVPKKAGQEDIEYLKEELSIANEQVYALELPNPKFLRLVHMPDKGSITTHTLCGADTKTEASSATGASEIISELIKQAQAVYDAQKQKKQ